MDVIEKKYNEQGKISYHKLQTVHGTTEKRYYYTSDGHRKVYTKNVYDNGHIAYCVTEYDKNENLIYIKSENEFERWNKYDHLGNVIETKTKNLMTGKTTVVNRSIGGNHTVPKNSIKSFIIKKLKRIIKLLED